MSQHCLVRSVAASTSLVDLCQELGGVLTYTSQGEATVSV